MAGTLLGQVQSWPVYRSFPELFILVPALLGLKGNLEMTLASRLSTLANLGRLSESMAASEIAVANLALVQLQGIVVGGLAALLPMSVSHFWDGNSKNKDTINFGASEQIIVDTGVFWQLVHLNNPNNFLEPHFVPCFVLWISATHVKRLNA